MTKEVLIQYSDIAEEVKDLRRRVEETERQLSKIESGGSVIDTVKGGSGGMQHFKVEGFPYPEYSRKKTLLYTRKANLEMLEFELLEKVNEVDEYINTLDDARIRRILRFRYIDNLSWVQVAYNMGGNCTADSVRMEHNRFIESKKVCSFCSD